MAVVTEAARQGLAPDAAGGSFWRRLTAARSLVSFAVVAILLGWIATHVSVDYRQTLRTLGQTNLLLFGLALASFYMSFLARARRWQLLLRNAGEQSQIRPLLHILMLTWFANCVLPAKAGDIYRAFLLRRKTRISGSKGLGTVVSERVLDFLVLMSLLLVSGFLVFRIAVPVRVEGALLTGVALAITMVVVLLALKHQHQRITALVPERFRERAEQFKIGLLDALGGSRASLVGLTVAVWAAESARLYLVTLALPLEVRLSPAQIIFVALIASLLTTIPALPGGLILVEGGMIAVLAVFGFGPSMALSVVILDRLISFWTPIGLGIALLLSTGQGRPYDGASSNVTVSIATSLQPCSTLLPDFGPQAMPPA
jgi:uncharacterized protein (TIRG00374 family)